MLSGLIIKKLIFIILINNGPTLTSTLAAGIVPDVFAGDAKRRRLEATSTAHAGNSSVS